ncbi:MAG: response regulator transcription factor [Bacteroidetes bacterium]|nr:response regulator transcription factor [Bacteroidota bacterium]
MNSKKNRVFLLEDDPNFGAVMKSYLEMNSYLVYWVKDGNAALKEFKERNYDLCILDVMLPNVDGFTIASSIRKIDSKTPIIFLTAKSMKADIVKGFKLGADDYITKPFDSDLLLLKIKAILRRENNMNSESVDSEINIGNYIFDYSQRTINYKNNLYKLSPKESELLHLLCIHKNRVLDRNEALQRIWKENSYFTTRSMDVFITKLRKYLKEDQNIEICNIHGSGFILKIQN